MTESNECFVIMPITVPEVYLVDRYDGHEDHFEKVQEKLIFPAVERAGFVPKSPRREGSENIHAGIINDLRDSAMVLADLSTFNANVFLELGIRTALDKPMCLIWDGFGNLPFDTAGINSHKYMPNPSYELNDQIEKLGQHITDTATRSRDGRNPLWKFFGTAADNLTPATIKPEDQEVLGRIEQLQRSFDQMLERERVEAEARAERDSVVNALVLGKGITATTISNAAGIPVVSLGGVGGSIGAGGAR